MKNYLLNVQLVLALIGLSLVQPYVLASSCNTPITKAITFERGATCWSYKGRGTDFYGNFGAGQKISVKLFGWSGQAWEPINPTVSDASYKFIESSQKPGVLSFIAPHAGKYTFTVYPCAFWGAEVKFTVCAV